MHCTHSKCTCNAKEQQKLWSEGISLLVNNVELLKINSIVVFLKVLGLVLPN